MISSGEQIVLFYIPPILSYENEIGVMCEAAIVAEVDFWDGWPVSLDFCCFQEYRCWRKELGTELL